MLKEIFDILHLNKPQSLQVTTDSRNCPADSIFFGLRGENFDGNQYAQQALDNGAAMVVIDNKDIARNIAGRYMLVDNSLSELQTLAREWREYLNLPVIGITGTNGKTTTKELTAAVLRQQYKIHFTQGNLNNQIGVPLTLMQINTSHQIAIVEMGASHPGDIKELVDIAEPQMGLITNIGKAHLLGFGSLDGVRRTKGELYDYLREHNGSIFLNEDDSVLCQMSQGLNAIPYIKGDIADCNPILTMRIGEHTVHTNLIGTYNADNVRAAISIGLYFNIPLTECIAAIEGYIPSNNRSMLKQTDRNTLIVDAYNANVTSMTAALNSIAQSGIADKTLILGDMLELGEYAANEHQAMVDKIISLGFTDVYLVGDIFSHTNNPFACFDKTAMLADYLTSHPLTNRTILLKGSRGMKLETLIPLL